MLAMSFAKSASRAIEKEINGHAKKIEKASIRALNKTAKTGVTIASKIIRKTVNVKARHVKKSLRIDRAKKGRQIAKIQSIYKGIPLSQYATARKTLKGVSVQMTKGKPRKLFKGAFEATMPKSRTDQEGQHTGYFFRYGPKRKVGKGRYAGSNIRRQAIKELYGPSIHSIFGAKINDIMMFCDVVLEKNLDHEIEYELSKEGKRLSDSITALERGFLK